MEIIAGRYFAKLFSISACVTLQNL